MWLSILVLFGFNLLTISSVSPENLAKQIFAWAIGLGLFFVGRQLNLYQLHRYRHLLLIISCVLILLPILLNQITRGSRRWIDIGPISFQPSEISKPLLMANISYQQMPLLHLIPVLLISLQPDLGSAISVFALLIPLVIVNKKYLITGIISISIFLLLSPVAYHYLLHPYQQNRLTQFLNPASDPKGQGYNVIQSKIAIGSGGLFGRGYRKGSQGQLLFLPEKHTDFIFAATAEERGFIGIVAIIFCYYLLIKSLIVKALVNSKPIYTVFTLGIAIQIWFQVTINIGMNLGLLPVTGIPLPFLSVGGSSIMALLFSLGIIHST
ncbi:MAG: FtsW/RodA/SpoVE family cell cycle protein [Candidatus Shapirobacteria bacterium]|jgi:rod shape determining protein RodA